jgi:hypothetical protein
MLLLTQLNKLIVSADSNKVDVQFDGFWRNHLEGICDITTGISGLTSEQYLDKYFEDVAVVDARGDYLKDSIVEDATKAAINDRYGMVSDILSNPVVFSDYAKQFPTFKRFGVDNPSSAISAGTGGIAMSNIQTQFGKVNIQSETFFDKKTLKKYNTSATSDKAPVVPVKDGSTPIAVNSDTKTAFTGYAGTYFYAITAKNRYGESAMVTINTSGQAVAATESVDIKFAAGTGGYAVESYVIYRTEADVANYQVADYHPILEVSTAELAAGWDGAAAGLVRDRNRFIPNTNSAIVMYNSPEYWEYLQLAPTRRMDFAITSPSRRFSILNYGTPVWYQPGKMIRIINIGRYVAA